MANMRKKHCANPACRKMFTYAPGEKIHCPWCGDASGRADGRTGIVIGGCWKAFRFGISQIPDLGTGCYTVRLERIATPKRLTAIKGFRTALSKEAPGLRESKMVIDGVCEGRPHTMTGLTADQVLCLMREGQMDLSYQFIGKRRRAKHA